MPARVRCPYSKGQKNDFRDCRSGAASDDEVRCDQDRRSAGLSGDASHARGPGEPTLRHHKPDPRLLLEREIEAIARQDTDYERLISMPGIGSIISKAISSHLGICLQLANSWEVFSVLTIQALAATLRRMPLLVARAGRFAGLAATGNKLMQLSSKSLQPFGDDSCAKRSVSECHPVSATHSTSTRKSGCGSGALNAVRAGKLPLGQDSV
jgi:hypothetical protein